MANTNERTPFIDSGITQACAKVFISNFRLNNPNYVKSILLDSEIITAIAKMATAEPPIPVTGIRVYFAQYIAGQGCVLGGEVDGAITTILALTQTDVNGVEQDMPNMYFDYGNPCPPNGNCAGDIIIAPPGS